jgi:hypothetical protein
MFDFRQGRRKILAWNSRQRHLSLSEGLLSALNYPHLLIVERVGERGLILYQAGDPRVSPDARARKVHYSARAMPRLSIGEDAALALGLVAGRYRARIAGGAIVATVWR